MKMTRNCMYISIKDCTQPKNDGLTPRLSTYGIQTQKCQTKAFSYKYVLKKPLTIIFLLKGTYVILELKDGSDGQTWKRSTPDTDGWFTLQNPNSERYLTAISAVDTIISGEE